MNQISLPAFFYVLRHAPTDWNDQGLVIGRHDIGLNEKGRLRAQKAAALLKKKEISKIISSPLRRAVETAEFIGNYSVDERLSEADFGSMEGQPKSQMEFDLWKKNPDFNQFRERVMSAFKGCQEGTLFVTHGSVLEILLSKLGLSFEDISKRSTKGRPLLFKWTDHKWSVSFDL